MATPTYTLIEEQVLGSSAASVTFSSIPGTYKDLVLEISGTNSDTNPRGTYLRFNADSTSSLYSDTMLYGNGSSASSRRDTGLNQIYADFTGALPASGSAPNATTVQIMSYTSTSVYKTALIRANRAAGGTDAIVGLWRNTNAITSVVLSVESSFNFATGSTFRLWGIA